MKIIYFIIACISLILGLIGVVLPILPTTPFLLVTAYCFARSSKRFHNWFTSTSIYKTHLESFVIHRSMYKHTKIKLLAIASTMLLIAMYFMDHILLRLFIFVLLLFKYYYFLFRIKTIEEE